MFNIVLEVISHRLCGVRSDVRKSNQLSQQGFSNTPPYEILKKAQSFALQKRLYPSALVAKERNCTSVSLNTTVVSLNSNTGSLSDNPISLSSVVVSLNSAG